jgi:hypothetical protein
MTCRAEVIFKCMVIAHIELKRFLQLLHIANMSLVLSELAEIEVAFCSLGTNNSKLSTISDTSQ